eukprot:TRINITY_DN23004_c0_g1_i1.p1 TRINITY_DN23004_c0_g1~~TRINITY_DN23004_c0_g1_i1.p1  ORF type:complete len:1093 (-),score=234.34 TRINITY_DN23004_c0_g1_i1:214-3492(-)
MAAAGSAGTLCCLAPGPGEEVACQAVLSAEACGELAASTFGRGAPLVEEALADGSFQPTWLGFYHVYVQLPFCVLVVACITLLALAPIYQGLNRCQAFRRFVLDRIGCLEHPVPRRGFAMSVLHSIQLLASFFDLGMFVCCTYLRGAVPFAPHLEKNIGYWFFFYAAVQALRQEFHPRLLLGLPRLVDVVTLPAQICFRERRHASLGWVTLGFLRSISALEAHYQLDKLGIQLFTQDQVTSRIIRMMLRLLTLVVNFASLILVFEVLGEIPFFSNETFTTSMGDISFFTLVYWAVETMTTVGYGDFAPKTIVTRFVTTVFMIAGIALFTVELNRVYDAIMKRNKSGGSYQRTKNRDLVVLLGGSVRFCDLQIIEPFAQELFNSSWKSDWPDLVMMTSLSESTEKLKSWISAKLPFNAQEHITVLVGSPFSRSDLKRCCCDSASMVFFLSDTSGTLEPLLEDRENILRALSLKNAYPKTPLRLLLLTCEAKDVAVNLGIRPERCVSINEFCCGLQWLSCSGAGWNTLLTNLMHGNKPSRVPRELAEFEPWLNDYVQGLGQQIYGFVISSKLASLSFREVAAQAYETLGVCVIAAQISGQIELAPLNRLDPLGPETVVYAIANDEASLLPLKDHSVDWREVFLKSRFQMFAVREAMTGQPAMNVGRLQKEGFLTFGSVLNEAPKDIRRKSRRRSAALEGLGLCEPLLEESTDASAARSSQASASRGSPTSSQRSWRRQQTSLHLDDEHVTRDEMKELEERTAEFRSAAREQPFALMLNLSESWDALATIIELDSREWLPASMPIVILSAHMPPKNTLEDLKARKGNHLAVVIGSPSKFQDLLFSGVKECSLIFSLGQVSGNRKIIAEMLDADVLMLHRMLMRVGVADKQVLLVFNHYDNMRLLPSFWSHEVEYQDEKKDEEYTEKLRSHPFFFDPYYASGQLLFPNVLGHFLANAYRTPGIVELGLRLFGPLEASSGGESVGSLAWQVAPEEAHCGLSYGALRARLLDGDGGRRAPALLVGILRRFDRSEADSKGYVWTNPREDVEVRSTDMLFALASDDFAREAHQEARLSPFWVDASRSRMGSSSVSGPDAA